MNMNWRDVLYPPDARRTVPWPAMGEVVTLYRPTGLHELRLVAETGWLAWPPRLPDQPIFYPVLNQTYAEEIAREWNARRNDPPVGFVTRFGVRSHFAQRYDIQVVGRESEHQELWIPAEELNELNSNLVGPIEVIGHFVGTDYTGNINPHTHLPADW